MRKQMIHLNAMVIKPWAIFVVLLSTMFIIFPGKSLNAKVIKVGVFDGYPPYEFLDNNQPTGFYIDVLYSVAEVMGLDPDVQITTQSQGRKSLEEGKIDLVIGLGYSEKSEQNLDFSVPIMVATHTRFVRKDSPIKYGFAVRKGDSELLSELQEGLRIIHTTGKYNELYDKWFAIHEQGFICKHHLKSIAVIIAVLLVMITAIIYWTWILKHKVAQKTLELSEELRERRKAEDTLKKSEQKHRLLIENAMDAIFLIQDGLIKFSNSQTKILLGYSEEELNRMPISKLIHQDDRKMVLNRYEKKIAGENPPNKYEFRMITKHGQEVVGQINATVVEWEGKPATLNIVRDITTQKKLEQQLQHTRKIESIGTLAGGIAHDFNNILGEIIGYVELALEKIDQDDPLRVTFNKIMNASNRAKDLIKQIQDFSRQSEHERKPIDLNLLVKDAIVLLQATMYRTVELKLAIESENNVILGDASQIQQVLMNLCANAYQAMQNKEGAVEINLSNVEWNDEVASIHDAKPGEYVKLSVIDHGEGMDAETKKRIFEPYFTTKSKEEGKGLGMAVVHGIIKSHQGAIVVDSILNRGTAIHIYFPKVNAVSESDAEETISQKEVLTTAHEKVLFIEDESELLDLIAEGLEHFGYQVVAMKNPLEALDLFQANPEEFDIVVTDMTMPNIRGDKLAKAMKLIRHDLPIILCSGFDNQITQEQARGLGISEFIMKPFLIVQLGQTIRKVLDRQRVKKG